MTSNYIPNSTLDSLHRSFKIALTIHTQLSEIIKDRFFEWIDDYQNGILDIEDSLHLITLAEGMLDQLWANEKKEDCPREDGETCALYDCDRCPGDKFPYTLETSPRNVNSFGDIVDGSKSYYSQSRGHKLPGAGDVSRDDQNRHQREARLGFKAPSEDWNESHRVIRCIWPNQTITRPIDKDNECLHNSPAQACLKIYFGTIQ